MSDDIEIPVVEITPGWSVDELLTFDDCDDAHAYLTGAICAIEQKVEAAQESGGGTGQAFRSLKAALRWKKAALAIVDRRRGALMRAARVEAAKTEQQRLIDAMKALYPEQTAKAMDFVRFADLKDTQ